LGKESARDGDFLGPGKVSNRDTDMNPGSLTSLVQDKEVVFVKLVIFCSGTLAFAPSQAMLAHDGSALESGAGR
jgi:hypothetical protein